MSTQALFDKIIDHLVTQGEPSGRYSPYHSDYDCLYRSVGSNGQTTMCAVGCLIARSRLILITEELRRALKEKQK